jgi:hypothetical protein
MSLLLLFGALTTYWDWINGEDNFFLHGLFCGLAYLPYLFYINWYAIVLRAVILGISMWIWCSINDRDDIEEYGRGALLIVTTPILVV